MYDTMYVEIALASRNGSIVAAFPRRTQKNVLS